MRRLLALLTLASLAWGHAQVAVVYPFAGADPIMGMVVSERVASVFGADAIGPDLAPLMTAPIAAQGGFVNPAAVLTPGTGSPEGLRVLAGTLGVATAVGGTLERDGQGWALTLLLEHDGRSLRTRFSVPEDNTTTLAVAASRWIAGQVGVDAPRVRPIDLNGVDGRVARARALVAAGFFIEAHALLETEGELDPVDAAWREGLRAAVAGTAALAPATALPAMTAMAALSSGNPDAVSAAIEAWVDAGAPPVAHVWQGVWARSQGDETMASQSLAKAANLYAYGVAAQAADVAVFGDPQVAQLLLRGLLGGDSAAALLIGSWVAGSLADAPLEDALLEALSRLVPTATYPFERRSFIAFDRDDALTAAQTLAVAVELDPTSDLYWTNLGWAWFLLDFLDRSELASQRALELAPAQVIARYNLGLVQAVTARLGLALDTYTAALNFDSRVEPEAIVDLQVAETRYRDAVGVPFALAFLLERNGERAAAAAALDRYLVRAARVPTHPDASAAFVREAQGRIEALRAPLPPIEIAAAPTLSLGRRGPEVQTAQPGDPLTLSFEVTTAGETLPRTLEVSVAIAAQVGAERIREDRATIDIPSGAIGFVVDTLKLELPLDLGAGTYTLSVRVEGDGMTATWDARVAVAGASDPFRRLLGRGLVPTALDSGTALLTARDLGTAPATVWSRWVAELQSLAELAEAVLPAPTVGRFEGQSGGEIFRATQQRDVEDFIAFLLTSDARESTFTLADAYAQWVIDGTPEGINP